MRRLVVFIFFAANAFSQPQVADKPGHEGGYGHFSIAIMKSSVKRENSEDIDNYNTGSLGFQLNGALGYTVFENFILAAMVQLSRISPQSFKTPSEVEPDPATFYEVQRVTSFRAGLLLKYYFAPSNVYLAMAPLVGQSYISASRFDTEGKNLVRTFPDTEWGAAFYGAIGHEIWLEEDVALGFHLFGIYFQSEKQGVKDSEFVVGLGIGFTTN